MWILPTLGRPDRCQRAIDAMVACGMTEKGIVCVGDQEMGAYRQLKVPANWRVHHWPALRPGPTHNKALKKYPNEPWYGLYADDFLARTPDFEKRLINAAGPRGIAWSNDAWDRQVEDHCSGTTLLGGDLVRAMGFISPPMLKHSYIDNTWRDIVNKFKNGKYLDEVVTEHLHAWANKAPNDATYLHAYSCLKEDQKAYEGWVSSGGRDQMFARIQTLWPKPTIRKDAKLCIMSPVGDGWFAAAYTMSLMASVRRLNQFNIPYSYFLLQKCSVLHHARNRLVGKFLSTDCTHLLFIDADMGWPEDAPLELLAHDKDVIAAVGVTKEEPPVFCVRNDKDTVLYDHQTGLLRVTGVGAAFMMIKRECIEKMAERYKDGAYKDVKADEPLIPQVFWTEVVNNEHMGEDITFCHRWRQMGGEIWIDPSIGLEHVGTKSYTGVYADALKEAADARERNQAA